MDGGDTDASEAVPYAGGPPAYEPSPGMGTSEVPVTEVPTTYVPPSDASGVTSSAMAMGAPPPAAFQVHAPYQSQMAAPMQPTAVGMSGQGYVMQPQMMMVGQPMMMQQPYPMQAQPQPQPMYAAATPGEQPTMMQPMGQPMTQPMVQQQTPGQTGTVMANGEPTAMMNTGVPQVTYVVAAPQQAKKPATLDQTVRKVMLNYQQCGVKGFNLDNTLLLTGLSEGCCAWACCFYLLIALISFPYASLIICWLSCIPVLVGSSGAVLSQLAKCGNGNAHKTGWVSILFSGLSLLFIAYCVYLGEFPWVIYLAIPHMICICCQLWTLYHWLNVVVLSQREMNQPVSYCDFA